MRRFDPSAAMGWIRDETRFGTELLERESLVLRLDRSFHRGAGLNTDCFAQE